MGRTWTEEQRIEHAAKLKRAWELKRQGQSNPIADDGIVPAPEPEPIPIPVVSAPAPKSPKEILARYKFSASDLIHQLDEIPLSEVSYADTGLLLNALARTSTRIAETRRVKQEQLEAGTHRAPCKTCGRMIDISKAGGFQILTERDEHFMPRNTYYCSQNCLLARNLPSHARSTPREKRENQA